MKSVLISIQPKWCELIANGKKTVEVRKTKPKIDEPFKCYIYCTKAKDYFSIGGGVYVANDELYRLPTGEIKFGDSFELMGDWRGQYDETNFLNGKVIGEFVCEKMSKFDSIDYITPEMVSIGMASCLTEKEFVDYVGNNFAYGWHISNLVIYDKPKELGDFTLARHCFNTKNLETVENCMGDYVTKYYNNSFCRQCKYYDSDCNWCDKTDTERPVTRPPQSWCYVEELGV